MSRTRMKNLCSVLIAGCLGIAVVSCGGGDDDSSMGGGALAAPAEPMVTALPGPALHLTWKDTPSEHHFSIERKEGTGAYKEVSTTLQNITQYHDADVTSGKTYSYRIAGSKENLEKGPYSAEVTATVP